MNILQPKIRPNMRSMEYQKLSVSVTTHGIPVVLRKTSFTVCFELNTPTILREIVILQASNTFHDIPTKTLSQAKIQKRDYNRRFLLLKHK